MPQLRELFSHTEDGDTEFLSCCILNKRFLHFETRAWVSMRILVSGSEKMGTSAQVFSLLRLSTSSEFIRQKSFGSKEFGFLRQLQSSLFSPGLLFTTGWRQETGCFGGTLRLSPSCWLCNSATESKDHLFFDCSFSKEVWRGLIRGLVVGVTTQWSTLLQVLVNGLHDKTKTFLFRYSFQAVVHALWFERNKRRTGESPQSSSRLIIFLDKQIRNRVSSLRKKPGSKYEKAMEMWFGR